MTNPQSGKLIIFLHGLGSGGSSMAPLGDVWQAALPDACFVAPDAPFPCHRGSGRQWFDTIGITEANRPQRVATARSAFDLTVGDVIADHGFAEALPRVAFVGFSQGAIMALDAVASGRWPVGAIVAFSGRLATPEPLNPSPSTKLLLVHGGADLAMPAAETERTAAAFEAHGIAAETVILPGLGHTISADGAQQACAFLVWALMAAVPA